jgi:hypothetical protein
MAAGGFDLASGALGAAASIYGAKVSAKAQKKAAQEAARQAELDRAESMRQFNESNRMRGEELGQVTQQFGEAKRLSDARKAAYEDMLARGTQQQTAAETQLMGETAEASPELIQAEKDMAARTSEGIQAGQSQMQANLAQQGVRGGQAATALRRGVGEMATTGMRDINIMKADDAARRNAIRSAYLASKGSQAGAASMQPAAY